MYVPHSVWLRGFARQDNDESVTIGRIQKSVADHYQISVDTLRVRSNARHILLPRQVAMYICKRLTKKSYPEIARQFGGKHHTTVLQSIMKIEKLRQSDPDLNRLLHSLIDSFH